ncbi:hypothetical protein CFRA_00475 [Corynebacterium frankenforstense DSM 45800]|uniref:Restriction endonuclease n=1 Tax=Corynebacterium frankenforstense DSM 45800 TaxID=1437875 RepID=A0A1L7CQ77_9CORY|nr:restriction endonuclease [Corynebacterium frankenforstense]APT88016.1 hypothetical protein CFRA_00475 [Corynebacterium frankenforstense DSM 45800]
MNTSVPKLDDVRPVVLSVLVDKEEPVRLRDLMKLVADRMGLDEAARAETVSSGQNRLANRVSWACSGLSHAGLVSKPSRGVYLVTDDGREVAGRGLTTYTEKDMVEWPKWAKYQEEVAARKGKKQSEGSEVSASAPGVRVSATSPTPEEPAEDPVEIISENVEALNAAVATELRTRLQEASPEFFENAVVELLWAMGYGGANGTRQHIGGTGDGGVDGVINQDALGLQQIYIQAKRYADGNTVGRPEIQQFFGALHSKGANGGVFITTSSFTSGAVTEARGYAGQMVLVDGIRLTELMLHYGVAVQPAKKFTVFEVDEEFFDDEI